MEFGLLIGLILIAILLMASIGLLIYSSKRKSKTGIVLFSITTILIASCYFINDFDQLSMTNDDVKNDLKYFNVTLNDTFEIVGNEVSGMPERIQETELSISKSDAQKIINQIKASENFKSFKIEEEVRNNFVSSNINDSLFNFKYPEFYSRELYKEVNNIPTRFYLYIEDGESKLVYKKFEQ